jgi:hypothetical protein
MDKQAEETLILQYGKIAVFDQLAVQPVIQIPAADRLA